MNAEIRIRPAAENDLDDLLKLAEQLGYGMTHLPPKRDLLAKKIQHSLQSFAKTVVQIGDELYFFVLEHVVDKKVIGCCGIISQAGFTHPCYKYKIIQQLHKSSSLHITHQNQFLQLVTDYQELTEIGMLALLPAYQHLHYGKFLSRVRFLFLAENLNRVSEKIISQIRGVIDERGHSLFWQSIGEKYIGVSFSDADNRVAKGDERFIAELLPDVPIAIELLPQDLRDIIGKAHPNAAPALELLKKEGFTYENYIDIFEGGPCLELHIKNNPTINHSQSVIVDQIKTTIDGDLYMMATYQPKFVACLGELTLQENNVAITEQAATLLNVQIGDSLRISL